jgi:hypothetical protein
VAAVDAVELGRSVDVFWVDRAIDEPPLVGWGEVESGPHRMP